MIKLERNFHPLCLRPSEAQRLTQEYKTSKSSVWNFDALKAALLETSHGKCAYCECDLTKESKYMEVEHFRDKDSFPDDVVTWQNLLPACKRCNGAKGSHNVVSDPIVNPYEINPQDHFSFSLYRLHPKTVLGEESIAALDLNNSQRAVFVRFEIGEKLHESILDAIDILETFKKNKSTRSKNRLLGTLKAILKECQPFSEYAATAATVLHSDSAYHGIVKEVWQLGLWDDELELLHDQSKKVTLSV